jgi:Eukaryotic aspartyl protease
MNLAAARLPLVSLPMKGYERGDLPSAVFVDVERVVFQRGYRFDPGVTEEWIVGPSFSAILDTGTSHILFPPALADEFARIYGCRTDRYGVYICECDMGPHHGSGLYFHFGPRSIYIPWERLADDRVDRKMCYTWVVRSPNDIANLGVPFLRYAYVVHHLVSFHMRT